MIIYKRTNRINGKVYIGKTKYDEAVRWKACVYNAYKYREDTDHLSCAIRFYGPEVFIHETIYHAKTEHELNRMETFFIILHQSHLPEYGYNMTLGGEGVCNPRPEVVEKIRQANLGLVITQEQRHKIKTTLIAFYENNTHPCAGKTYEEIHGEERGKELRRINSDARKGKSSRNKGRKASSEVVEINRRAHIGLPSHRKGVSVFEEYGTEKASELIKRNRETHLGRVHTEVQCEQQRQIMLKRYSEETWEQKEERIKRIIEGKRLAKLHRDLQKVGVLLMEKDKIIHKNCGGEIVLDEDAYRCKKCKRGYKCVGYEEYLKEISEVEKAS